MEIPETTWLRTPDGVHLACQLVGVGPVTVLLIGFLGDVETGWEIPLIADVRTRIVSFARLLVYDERGVGRSDPVPSAEMPPLDVRVEDLQCALDLFEIDQVAIFADTDGGPVALAFAAQHPERVSALVLSGTYARLAWAPDYTVGWSEARIDGLLDVVEGSWGDGMLAYVYAPSIASRLDVIATFSRLERRSNTPGQVLSYVKRTFATDVRSVLPHIQAPTLVLHCRGDLYIAFEHGQLMADAIPGARLVELPGNDRLLSVGDVDSVMGEIEEFITGTRATSTRTRVMRTVMFADLVESTERLGLLGDQEYRRLLENYGGMANRQIERFSGVVSNTMGDGLVATFDGPSRALESALMLREGARRLELDVRVGIHSGEIELTGTDIAGIAVHTAARVQASADPGEIVVTRTVVDLVAGSGISFDDLGEHPLKGVDGTWRLFSLISA